ncbi:MAG: class I SAM-dependent methyltransferase [Magnetococcales bacterium]|nr:class I SAM-dependent methyltransferase [Magnetococcales bacterium]
MKRQPTPHPTREEGEVARATCHLCGAQTLDLAPAYDRLFRVTSDCRPFGSGGAIGCCCHCGLIQKRVDAQWEAEARTIYDTYRIYAQSGGGDHALFDAQGGVVRRADLLVARLLEAFPVPATGRLLDVGCGNGNLLARFAQLRPDWRLCGTEWNDTHRQNVQAIPGVEGFYAGDLDQVAGGFDLITLVHILEHTPDPRMFLRRVRDRLNPGGMLFIHLPDVAQNPFDLLNADHCSHFTQTSLGDLLAAVGLEVVVRGAAWVAKEMSFLTRVSAPGQGIAPTTDTASANIAQQQRLLRAHMAWLQATGQLFRQAHGEPLGLFGTSIAATWLFQERAGAVDFFVDEDQHQVGRRHLDRPILAPAQVVDTATVLMPFSPARAREIVQRLAKPGLHCLMPPALENHVGVSEEA